MSCETYKDPLNSAAAGGPMTGALRAHLGTCADCRAAFAEEQAVLASIDAGLHVVANSELPPSLIPSLRVRLQEQVPQRRWMVLAFVPAAAAILVALLFVAHQVRLSTAKPSDSNSTASVSSPAPPAQFPSPKLTAPVGPPTTLKSSVAFVPRRAARAVLLRKNSNDEGFPEALVPPDQEALLARYVEQLRIHKHVQLMAELRDIPLEPLELTPIQIEPLDVKSLAEAGSR